MTVLQVILGIVRSREEKSLSGLFDSIAISNHVNEASRRAKLFGVPCESTEYTSRKIGSPLRQMVESIAQVAEQNPYCPCCGKAYHRNRSGIDEGATGRGGPRKHSPTLHRIVPEKGYVTGNVIFICYACNMSIGDIGGDPADITVRLRAIAWQISEGGFDNLSDIATLIFDKLPMVAEPKKETK